MKTETNSVQKSQAKVSTKMIAQISMLSALAIVLMLFDIPLPFAPSFYQIDFSEVPVLVGGFVIGPLAGVVIELVKILLNFMINGSDTAGIGELANFLVGCALVIPAGIIYKRNKTRKGAIAGMTLGTVLMTVVGCVLNAFVLLPVYAKVFGMPIEALLEMGTAVNKGITGMSTFILYAVAPFNLLKGALVSIVVFLIYHKISPIFRMR